jgi:hypothetical protein
LHDEEVVSVRAARVTVAVALGLAATSCSGNGSTTTSDCQNQVRADDIVYTSYGYTEHPAARYASADAGDCHDVGEGAAGSVFTEHPRQVTTWVFSGFPPEKVLGVRVDRGSFVVFVADSVSPEDRDRIHRDLARRPRQAGA